MPLDPSLLSLLALSLGLGILHAFDADHVVAVSSMASRERRWRHSILFALKWAIGHGGVLLVIAAAAMWMKWQLPESLTYLAEKSVGVILIIAGLSIFWTFRQQRIAVRIHQHGDQVHAHLTTPDQPQRHEHAPVLVGIVHGVAGSAPAIALIPATMYSSALGIGYIVLFSLGVLFGMAGFGLLLGQTQKLLLNHSPRLFDVSRILLGIAATVLGVVWLHA